MALADRHIMHGEPTPCILHTQQLALLHRVNINRRHSLVTPVLK